ncbi:MAG: serine hydrolase [Ruminiclostridium sp.]|nr:serine hydrolase [Ruminiclostridium sp.]
MKNKVRKIITAIFLSGTLALNTIPDISAETLNSKNCYIYAAFENITVRKGPGTEYDKIGTIKSTGKITYIDEELDKNYIPWYKVKFKNGKTGWITSNYSRRYIKKSALPEIEKTEKYVSDGTAYGNIYEQISDSAEKYNAVGVQVSVIRGSDGKVFDFAYGWADYGTREMTVDSKMRSASLSKVATAICAVKMEEQGIVGLGKNIEKYWDVDIPVKVSLKTLLTHTSTFFNLGYKNTLEETAEQLQSIGSFNTKKKPGKASAFEYNNFASSIAATTLELASGVPIEEYARENLFSLLDGDLSYFPGNIKDTDNLITHYDYDHSVELLPKTAKKMVFTGNIGDHAGNYIGGLTGSASDIAKIFSMLANDGVYGDNRILSEESVKTLEKRYFTAKEHGGKFKQCLTLRYYKKLYGTNGLYYHTGNAYGIVSLASYDPVTKNTVVVMTSGAKQSRDKRGIYKICGEITKEVYKNIDKLQ